MIDQSKKTGSSTHIISCFLLSFFTSLKAKLNKYEGGEKTIFVKPNPQHKFEFS
jgi:hypothetical protein